MALKNTIVVFALLFPASLYADTLKPFKSDGCSAFPEGTIQQNKLWLRCCTQHDFTYWKGGTYDERLTADRVLKECVEKVGEPEVALMMLAGVRVGGTPYLPTAFRWGYGWSYPRFYGPLSKEELQQVIDETANDASKNNLE